MSAAGVLFGVDIQKLVSDVMLGGHSKYPIVFSIDKKAMVLLFECGGVKTELPVETALELIKADLEEGRDRGSTLYDFVRAFAEKASEPIAYRLNVLSGFKPLLIDSTWYEEYLAKE